MCLTSRDGKPRGIDRRSLVGDLVCQVLKLSIEAFHVPWLDLGGCAKDLTRSSTAAIGERKKCLQDEGKLRVTTQLIDGRRRIGDGDVGNRSTCLFFVSVTDTPRKYSRERYTTRLNNAPILSEDPRRIAMNCFHRRRRIFNWSENALILRPVDKTIARNSREEDNALYILEDG